MLDAATVRQMNDTIDSVVGPWSKEENLYQSNAQQRAAPPGHTEPRPDRFSFLETHPIFLELMADTRVLDVIRVMCGDWLRLDHAYGIEMDSSWAGRENLHGGARTDQGEHQYQWHQG